MKKKLLLSTLIILSALILGSCDLSKKECKHNYTDEVIAPTCAAEGYTKYTCTECGDTYNDVYTQKVAHPYTSVVVSPSCAKDGYTEHTCLVCGESYTDTQTPKIPHSYENTIVPPTCVAEGYTLHACTNCDYSYSDNITGMTTHRFNASPCVYCGLEEVIENITPNTEWYVENQIHFVISTKEELAGLASLVNSGVDFTDQIIYLNEDLNLGYNEWIPIGNAEYPFSGTFDGQGHTISNLKINTMSSHAGLFGNVNGSISDFNINNASIYVKNNAMYISIACGYSENPISNVTVSGYIDAKKSNYVGAIAGAITAHIDNCENSAEVNGADYTGGIAGMASNSSANYSNLTNSGAVKGKNYVGGIIGGIDAIGSVQTDIISNTGNVSGTSQVGGVFGYINAKIGSSVYGATVCAEITADYYVGGIIGKTETVEISHCKNDGSIITANSYLTVEESFYAYLGGYVGSGYIVTNCTNNVNISYNSRGIYIGGIAGYLHGYISNCENNGSIEAFSNAGGLVGEVKIISGASIYNLKNNGSVSGKAYVGGIIGRCVLEGNATFYDLSNTASVIGTDKMVGGIIGSCNGGSYTLTVEKLENNGEVQSGKECVGGLFGYVNGSTSSVIKHSSSSASISGKYKVGGLIGQSDNVALMDSSNANSTVTATGWMTDNTTDYAYLGGYVGLGHKVTGCTNDVNINYDGTGIFVGGIIGYATGEVQDCINNGNISSCSDYVGGIAGHLETSQYYNLTYKNLSNTGSITGYECVGGIAGQLNQYVDVVQRSRCWKDTKSTLYLNDLTTICSNFKNSGTITGNTRVAGILGNVYLENIGLHWDDHNSIYCDDHYHEGRSKLSATIFENTGIINASNIAGEIFGGFFADLASTVIDYVVTGTITLNGEVVEGTYDVGSQTNLTLSEREIYALTEEAPELGEENTEIEPAE